MSDKQFFENGENDISTLEPFSRRNFLKLSGSGLFIFFAPGTFGKLAMQQRGRSYPTDLNAYLKIGEDGRVTLFCSKIEMGQGIITSMRQMLAEELDVSFDSVDTIMGDTMLCPWDSGTTGSRSTKYYGPPLRRAGAEARAVLLQMASEILEIPTEQLEVKDGKIRDKNNIEKTISYASLVKGKQITKHISDVPIKKVSEHGISGQSKKRVDSIEKLNGEAKFAADIRLPGMLYAKVLRPPSHEASLISLDVSKARTVNNAVVINENDLVAVLHEHPEEAEKALSKIKAEWDVPDSGMDNQSVFKTLKEAAPEGRVYVENGNVENAHGEAHQYIEQEYYNHYVAHAPIEPYAVVADVKKEKVKVWASTQAPFRVRETVADTLQIPEEDVHVITPFVGGGFGGKKSGQQIVEAVKLSKLTGRPVQLAWTRKEEFFYDAVRPAAVVQMKTGMSSSGLINSWECDILFSWSRSSEPIYNIPHYRVKTKNKNDVHPFATGAWRGPGSNTNVFAMESHTDILAKAAKQDPLQFRFNNLCDERMIRVLRAADEKFGKKFSEGPSGKGYGIACTNYLNTYVATIMQVSVNKSTGKVKVEHVVCAQDMGEIINPQGAILQVEGGITMGLSAALYEELEFSGGKRKTENFNTYDITRFSDVPSIEVVLIDNPEIPPQGCGEPAITTVGAALANAIYDAVGARVYTLPITPERILAAMEKD